MATIFLSYRREDSAGYAGRLCESLERRLGKGEVFRDVNTIHAGEDFVDAIQARLRECRALLVVIGREWLNAADASRHRRLDQEGDYLRQEIVTGLASPNVLVVPVLVEGMTMPPVEELPEAIRALGRRQAVSLRDETWDADVDRLLVAVTGSSAPAVSTRTKSAALFVAVLAIALLAAVFVARRFSGADKVATGDPGRSRSTSTGAAASAIAIPRAAEIVGADALSFHLVYTLLSGGVARGGDTTTLSLRFRFSNDGPYNTFIGADTFRLAVGSSVLTPSTVLGEIVPSHAARESVIRFQVPAETRQAVLTVRIPGATAELPLDLSSTGRASETERPDAGDARPRALLAPLVTTPRPLIAGSDIAYTLTRATIRRFVNALRIIVNIRMTNRGQFPRYFGGSAFRVLVDGQATAPVDGPNEAVASNSDASGDFVFDVPPATRHVILRVIEGSTADVPLDLPPATR